MTTYKNNGLGVLTLIIGLRCSAQPIDFIGFRSWIPVVVGISFGIAWEFQFHYAMQEQLYWTDLCMAEISDELADSTIQTTWTLLINQICLRQR